MRVDAVLTAPPSLAAIQAAELEALGFAGAVIPEAAHDAFITAAMAATGSTGLRVGTSVAIALARSPMVTAYAAHDVQQVSGGRFELGLGPQIPHHVAGRFSMPADRPAARMREYVAALRAIFACWEDGNRLSFEGDFWSFDRMSAMFSPGPATGGPPPILLGAVGPKLTAVAAEVADGLILHPMVTPEYLHGVTLPVVRGSGRDVSLTAWVMVATGTDEETVAEATELTRAQVAFYGSTPAYRPMLEVHGDGDLQPELQRRQRAGDVAGMSTCIDDTVLARHAVVGEPAEVARQLRERYEGTVDRVCLTAMSAEGAAPLGAVLERLRPAS